MVAEFETKKEELKKMYPDVRFIYLNTNPKGSDATEGQKSILKDFKLKYGVESSPTVVFFNGNNKEKEQYNNANRSLNSNMTDESWEKLLVTKFDVLVWDKIVEKEGLKTYKLLESFRQEIKKRFYTEK